MQRREELHLALRALDRHRRRVLAELSLLSEVPHDDDRVERLRMKAREVSLRRLDREARQVGRGNQRAACAALCLEAFLDVVEGDSHVFDPGAYFSNSGQGPGGYFSATAFGFQTSVMMPLTTLKISIPEMVETVPSFACM